MQPAPLSLLLVLAPALHAADSPAPPPRPAAPVELPPMMVEESTSSVPWLYVSAGGIEFLSRCSASTTRHLARAWLDKMQLARVLVPEEFLVRMDAPEVFVLYGQDVQQTVSAEIARELKGGDKRPREGARGAEVPRGGVNIAPSMRLSDRDMHASIAYIDEALFEAAGLSVAPGHMRYLLNQRVPELPGWLAEGLERNYRRADFVIEPITLGPLIWMNSAESEDLAWDPTRPRALLPANELFAPEPVRATENRHGRHVAARFSTQELFIRWAIVSGEATRAALWRFAHRAIAGPVTEEMFEAEFGFDFAELRDRLSDYLPKAVSETLKLPTGKLPPLPPIEVEPATANQIARVRGEWERLAIGHVSRHLPQVREPYIAQARRTLRRAYDTGDRDPRLLATLGLVEVDADNVPAAREYLEAATALGVIRPRAYYELARVRFAELRRDQPATKHFTYAELAPVLHPLRQTMTQAPPLPEVFTLLAEAWARCDGTPNPAELAELETGLRLFSRRPEVVYPLALALAHHGNKAEAAAALAACSSYVTDAPTQAGIARLRAELATSSSADL